jgi:predicted HD superfamily hydrolase involved in NAD metabolism
MFTLSHWPYIKQVPLTGSLYTDYVNLLTANGKTALLTHCISVSETCGDLAGRFKLDRTLAQISGLLHDCSGMIRPEDMLDYAEENHWILDDAEKAYPFLLHQRLSAIMANEWFGIREEAVLSAIECHTTLKRAPSAYDLLLFISDKLSWDQAGVPPYYDPVMQALDSSLEYASLLYIRDVLTHNRITYPHSWLKDAFQWLKQRTAHLSLP